MSERPAATRLGRFLTGTEAKDVADRLDAGATLTKALHAVEAGRRPELRDLLEQAGLGTLARERTVDVLRAIEGARSTATAARPLWTMPGHLAHLGALTPSVGELVAGARQSVTCSTYNFQKTSALWDALRAAAARPEITVRVYVDGAVTGQNDGPSSAAVIATHLKPATVLCSRQFDGKAVRNHAKFLVVDHRFVLVTSANFSWSAEQHNVEFGVNLDNPNLAEAVEDQMRRAEGSLYQVVLPVFGSHPTATTS